MHPDDYKRPRKCWSCGRAKWTIDPYMTKRDTRKQGCTCAGYAWGGVMSGAMHRRGSLRCWYSVDGSLRMPSDEEIAAGTA